MQKTKIKMTKKIKKKERVIWFLRGREEERQGKRYRKRERERETFPREMVRQQFFN